MARPTKYDEDAMLDAGSVLVDAGGLAALSIAAVAKELGAPSGSIYHRFESRDTLAAALWLRAVERFQHGWAEHAEEADPVDAVRRCAAYVVGWSRANPADARLLLLYRSGDFCPGAWPEALVERNEQQRSRVADGLSTLCGRLGAVTPAAQRRVRFALVDLPYGAVRGPLAAGGDIADDLEELVDDAVVAVLGALVTP